MAPEFLLICWTCLMAHSCPWIHLIPPVSVTHLKTFLFSIRPTQQHADRSWVYTQQQQHYIFVAISSSILLLTLCSLSPIILLKEAFHSTLYCPLSAVHARSPSLRNSCYDFRIYSAMSLYSHSVLSKWQYSTVMSPSSRFNLSAWLSSSETSLSGKVWEQKETKF